MPASLLPPFSGDSAELPALSDPLYGGPGPYATSPLRVVTGPRANPEARSSYVRAEGTLAQAGSKLSCFHPRLAESLADVAGLDPRWEMSQPPVEDWPITGVVPMIVPGAGRRAPFPCPPLTYLVAYDAFVPHPGGTCKDIDSPKRLRESLPEGSSLILTLHGNYDYLNAAMRQTEPFFWEQSWLYQFDGIVIDQPDPFANSPYAQQLIAERWHQMLCAEGAREGAHVIPALAWGNEAMLRRQVLSWALNPRINTIYVDAYGPRLHKATWAWRWIMALERYVAPQRHIRWLIGGLTSGWQVQELRRIFPAGNFAVCLSRNRFVHAQEGTALKEIHAARLQRVIDSTEALRTGTALATKQAPARPDHWPTLTEALALHRQGHGLDGSKGRSDADDGSAS